MDGKEFDEIAQKLGSFMSRRRALGGLAAGLLGAAGLTAAAEAKNAGKTKSAGQHKGNNKKKVGKEQVCPNGCLAIIGGVSVCVPGTDEARCGQNGQACAACGGNQVCAPNGNRGGGTCQLPAGCCTGATAATCATSANTTGRCQASSTCLALGGNNSCGFTVHPTGNAANPFEAVCNPPCNVTGGNICSGTTQFSTCAGQVCGVNTVNPCTTGCCNGNTCVVAGTNAALCGTNGGTCINCNAALGPNAVCIAAGATGAGTCALVGCGAGTNNPCANGCCNGNQCVTTTSATQCGNGGGVCQNCTALLGAGATCNAGNCQAAPCGAGNCAGCCSNNTCQSGTSPSACGLGGVGCTVCSGKKKKCKGGICKKH